MFTAQEKLTGDEWKSIERPLAEDKLNMLKFIQRGFHNPSLIENSLLSLYSFLKLTPTPALDAHLCTSYFKLPDVPTSSLKLKQADKIRIEHASSKTPDTLYEKLLLDLCKKKEFFHLHWMSKLNVKHKNPYVMSYVQKCLDEHKHDLQGLSRNAVDLFEKNPYAQYQDHELYSHQKELFTKVKGTNQLILYMTPTGSGKTTSPIGLAEKFNIIFICAARHVGLAFANMCCSLHIGHGFAYGCETETDIRLHYSAAKKYIRNKKTGGIQKVDNSIGDNARVMISDLKSFEHAMNYMMRHHDPNTILVYWDEPTISMKDKEHPLHDTISHIWKINTLTMILSSATLPQIDYSSITDKEICWIKSHEFTKTIQLITPTNCILLPHMCCKTYQDLQQMIHHLEQNPLVLKYADLSAILQFLKDIPFPFTHIDEITILNIKLHYLHVLKNMSEMEWNSMKYTPITMPSTIRICAEDTWTCSHGPTIYLADDVQKIATYCLQSANIPADLLNVILKNLEYNNAISKEISKLEKDMKDKNKDDDKEKKMAENRVSSEIKQLQAKIAQLQASIQSISLPDIHIPNKYDHLKRYGHLDKLSSAFTSSVDIPSLKKILATEVDSSWKILLMIGIGVFTTSVPSSYIEIVKELASQQHLYLIIANTSYMYGTNYQFANAYVAKDLVNVSQDELIQVLGRVGRGNQVPYSIRFRDEQFARTLFMPQPSPEAETMLRLFQK
jgi:hypothetical protein